MSSSRFKRVELVPKDPSFCMLRVRDAVRAVQPQDFFTSVDLCDALQNIDNFVRFNFHGNTLQFKVLLGSLPVTMEVV